MTRSIRLVAALFFVLTATAAFSQTDAQKSFNNLKVLAGSWEGKSSRGYPVQVSYKVTAGGSTLMSELTGHGEDMISMFNLDGANRLLMIHYCSAGNQPRMQASASPDGKTITFDFVDATNLGSPDAGHMQRVVIALLDANHHTEEWTYIDHGKEEKELNDLRRK